MRQYRVPVFEGDRGPVTDHLHRGEDRDILCSFHVAEATEIADVLGLQVVFDEKTGAARED